MNNNEENKLNSENSTENKDIKNNKSTVEKTDNINKKNIKRGIALGACVLAVGIGAVMLNDKNNKPEQKEEEFEDFIVKDLESVKLDFANKTAQEMREYYTLEGEEYIKKIYPNSEDSDLALLTVGKTLDKEFSKIKFTTTNNEKIKLKDLKGKRIILDFALSTCPSCGEEFEYLSSKKNTDKDILLHIFPQDTTEEIKQAFKEAGVEFNGEHTVSLTGMDNKGFEDFNVTHVPTKIYINEEGVVTYVTTNTLSDEEQYKLHYDRAFGDGEKMLDFLKTK